MCSKAFGCLLKVYPREWTGTKTKGAVRETDRRTRGTIRRVPIKKRGRSGMCQLVVKRCSLCRPLYNGHKCSYNKPGSDIIFSSSATPVVWKAITNSYSVAIEKMRSVSKSWGINYLGAFRHYTDHKRNISLITQNKVNYILSIYYFHLYI